MFRSPFTASQWQELEHQALIFKYLLAGAPVPPELLIPICRSFGSQPAPFYPNPTLGYYSYYGKKLDPEPGRCRRTDGKKWRCSKDAYPDSKYCERHMHRGKNRSRKPVESQTLSQSQSSSSTVTSLTRTGSIGGSLRNNPIEYSVSVGDNSQRSDLSSYAVGNKDYRYVSEVKPEVDERSFICMTSGNTRGSGVESSFDSSWHPVPSRGTSNPLSKAQTTSVFPYPQLHSACDLVGNQPQSTYMGSDFGLLPEPVKNESSSLRPFFDEWPKTRDLWSDMDDHLSFSNTKLSMSIPMASSDFSTTTSRSPNND